MNAGKNIIIKTITISILLALLATSCTRTVTEPDQSLDTLQTTTTVSTTTQAPTTTQTTTTTQAPTTTTKSILSKAAQFRILLSSKGYDYLTLGLVDLDIDYFADAACSLADVSTSYSGFTLMMDMANSDGGLAEDEVILLAAASLAVYCPSKTDDWN